MQSIRRLFRRASWLAIFAMLGLALAPTVSHALAGAGPGNPWAEVCSAAGGKLGVADAAGEQAGAGAHLWQCPLCGHLGNAPALPVSTSSDCAACDDAGTARAFFTVAQRLPIACSAAQPRAPPAAC